MISRLQYALLNFVRRAVSNYSCIVLQLYSGLKFRPYHEWLLKAELRHDWLAKSKAIPQLVDLNLKQSTIR